MRILHTADWHIGKKLHTYDLSEDFDLWISWLSDFISREKVDVLLVSGDVFDLANPSAAARSQYYQSLVKLKEKVPQIILTGGNHDSPAMLNAPKELMSALNLQVIGGLPENIEEALIPLKNEKGETEIIIAAIPYLRNPDLKNHQQVIKTYEDRLKALREGIAEIYRKAEEACKDLYPNLPVLAMGHLFAAGVEASDSERDIQIGNAAKVYSSAFGDYFNYVALGHIHKPQQVSANIPVYYSGSPLALSFSERENEKRVLLIDTERGWEPESHPIPQFRKLIKINGNLDKIKIALDELPENGGLTHLIEIELHEEQYQIKLIQDVEQVIADFDKEGYQIVKHRVRFAKALKQTGDLYEEHINLEELQPEHVFDKRLEQEEYSDEEKNEIRSAFIELLEEVNQH